MNKQAIVFNLNHSKVIPHPQVILIDLQEEFINQLERMSNLMNLLRENEKLIGVTEKCDHIIPVSPDSMRVISTALSEDQFNKGYTNHWDIYEELKRRNDNAPYKSYTSWIYMDSHMNIQFGYMDEHGHQIRS